MSRDDLMELVFTQIERDIFAFDYTAIEELLRNVSDSALMSYLPEECVNAKLV